MPYTLTQHGIKRSKRERAIAANIHIIRVFPRMRQLLLTHKNIMVRLEEHEKALSVNRGVGDYLYLSRTSTATLTFEKLILTHGGRLTKPESELQVILTLAP